MNVVEVNTIKKCIRLIDKVLEGKVENLPKVKELKFILKDLIEFKDFD